MKKIILLLIAASFTNIFSQSHQWSTDAGSTALDGANEVKVDGSSNVISVGYFNGTVDFDPSAATVNMSTGGSSLNGFILKQSATGAFVWVKGLLGTGACNIKSITTDLSSNVYVTGEFAGTIDFDPGAAVFNMTTSATTDVDAFVCKLTSAGVFVWAKSFGAITNDDMGRSIGIDGTGNVFVAGHLGLGSTSTVTVDLNPGPAVNLFNISYSDGFILKLDNSGNYLTAQIYGTSQGDKISKLTIDPSNNVYIVGNTTSGIPQLTLTVTYFGMNSFVAKLDNALVKQWGTVYTGTSPTYLSSDVYDIALDATGNVFTTGYHEGLTDFDGTAGTYTLTSPISPTGIWNGFIAKHSNSTGAIVWAKNIADGTGDAVGTGISIDALGNVFAAGYFSGIADFNPTAAVYKKGSAGLTDIFTIKLDNNGVFSNDAQVYGSTGNDVANGIQTAGTGIYYITGYYTGTVDYNSTTVTNTLSSAGQTDMYVAKYGACTVPVLTTASSPTLITVCANTSTVLSVSASSGVTYNWFNSISTPTSLGSGTPFTTPVITTTTSFWAEGTNTCSSTARVQFSVNTTPTPTVTITNSGGPSICAGTSVMLTASGATSYTWNTGPTTNTIVVTPSITTTYTALGSNGGCVGSRTISVNVTPLPSGTVTASSPTLCSGQATTLTATGATTYSWSTGPINTTGTISVAPVISTLYTVSAQASGCYKTYSINIAVSPTPTVNVSASSSSICSGSTSSLTASGASTYSWSTGATGTSISVSPTITTVYTATGTSASGCRDTQTLSIGVTATPTLSTSNYTICAGGTATLSAAGATTYSWSTGATTSSITVTPTANTTYTVTGNNGSCSDVNTVSVTVGSALSIAVTPTAPSICIGNSGTMTASGATSYTWSTGSNSTAIVVSPTISTTYTISGTSGACSGTRTISMIVNPNPTVTATSSSSVICTGSSATLNATGAASYNWNPGSLSGTSVVVSPTINTTYTVVGSSAAGCTNTKTISVTVSACTGINENQNLTGAINIYPNPNNGEFTLIVLELGTYVIINSIGQTVETILINENSQTINVNGLADGIYYVIGKTSKAKIVVSK